MVQITQNELVELIHGIEYPEIANTLKELGMIGNITLNNEQKSISVTLVLPMMTIPILIKDMLINSIADGIREKGSKLKISFAQMNEEQRIRFFAFSKQNWKL